MAQLEINHRTVNFNNRILQLRMITSVGKFHGIKPRKFSWLVVVIAIVIAMGGLSMIGDRQAGVGLVASLGAGAFAFYAIKQNLKPRDYWALKLETASGSSNLLASTDERVIDEAVQSITAAMEADASFQHTVIINDSTIVNDAVIAGSVSNRVAKMGA